MTGPLGSRAAAQPRLFPERIANWIGGAEKPAASGDVFEKISPHDGAVVCRAARSGEADVAAAVSAALAAQPSWAAMPGVARGDILHNVATALKARAEDMAQVVALETGKSFKDALGETKGAILQGLFMAGEGMRLYGRTTTSGGLNKQAMTVRAPLGVAGLIIAANTPVANVAWKVFPALICGNAAVLKASEDAPATAWLFGEIARDAGLPAGVLNIVQGLGAEAGRPLVADPRVAVSELHRLDRGRTRDRARRRRTAGEDFARTRRQEPACCLRRRRSRCRGGMDRSCRPSAMPASAAPPAAASLFSTACMTLSAPNCWSAPAS